MSDREQTYLLSLFLSQAGTVNLLTKMKPSEVRARFNNPDSDGFCNFDCQNEICTPVYISILRVALGGFGIGEMIEKRVQRDTLIGARS
jgi:hypothetical protein